MTRKPRTPKAATSSEIPSGIEGALAAEAKGRKAKAEKPPAETDAEKIARLEKTLAAVDAERQTAIKLLEAFGKRVSILGGEMQACVQQR